MAEQQTVEPRRGREGGRWINERPTSEEFGAWWDGNMKIDPALDAADYVGGVVLIPAVDTKAKFVTGFTPKGLPIIEEGEELSYIPYAKVETRINYFWDLMAAHEEWVAVVEPVALARMPVTDLAVAVQEVTEGEKMTRTERPAQPGALASLIYQLPEGFSVMSIPVGEGYSHFLCCTQRVSIYRADEDGEPKGRPLRTGRGTKQVPMHKGGYGNRQPYADDSSLMKAETGALGRALGFAGIFVIPGSGVATAEDVQEGIAQGQAPTQAPAAAPDEGNAGPAAPEAAPARTGAEQAVDDEGELKQRSIRLWKQLEGEHPQKAEEFLGWARERNLASLGEAKGAMLRGVVKTLERLNDEAEKASQQGGGESDGDAAPASTEPSGQAG